VSSRFVADACAVIAFFTESGRAMTPAGRAAMQDPPWISAITVWELTRKIGMGKLPPLTLAGGSLSRAFASDGFLPLPLTWADGERANALPPLHKDPMDRMLIAQALNAGLTIITNDRLFDGYGVGTVW